MQSRRKLIEFVLVGLGALSSLLLALSVIINFSNIFGRYVLHVPIEWAEEVMLYFMIALVLLGGAGVAWEDRHIKMDVLVRLTPMWVQSKLQLVCEVVFLLTTLGLVYFAAPTVFQLFQFDQRSQAADIPMFIPQSVVPIGMLAMAFFIAMRLLTGRWREPPAQNDH
jgi:C4-dicarboxylate transporter DctQ subunit